MSRTNDQAPHVAIIMDGNGRWAVQRGLPRAAGHRAGARAVRRAVAAAQDLGIGTLTLHALSSDNMRRPLRERLLLLAIVREYLEELASAAEPEGPRVRVIGRRDRLPDSLVRSIEAVERETAEASGLLLRIAVDYSARDAILRTVRGLAAEAEQRNGDASLSSLSFTFDAFTERLERAAIGVPDVDLLIRTGGEQRLSDFLLWECAYAELYFTDVAWPDFGAAELADALAAFGRRERRFGLVPASAGALARPTAARRVASA